MSCTTPKTGKTGPMDLDTVVLNVSCKFLWYQELDHISADDEGGVLCVLACAAVVCFLCFYQQNQRAVDHEDGLKINHNQNAKGIKLLCAGSDKEEPSVLHAAPAEGAECKTHLKSRFLAPFCKKR